MNKQDTKLDSTEFSAIAYVINEIVPLEAAVVGEVTVNRIASGHKFKSAEGGHNLDLTMAIGVVASVATVAHYAWLVGIESARKMGEKKNIKKEVIEETLKRVERVDNLKSLIKDNPTLVSDVCSALETLKTFQEAIEKASNDGQPRD